MPKEVRFQCQKATPHIIVLQNFGKKGLEDSVKVNKALMWMGPEACVKQEQHQFLPGDKGKLEPLWNFFDNLCSKKEGC